MGSNLEKGVQALKSSQLVREGRPKAMPSSWYPGAEQQCGVGSYGLADREGPSREVIVRN